MSRILPPSPRFPLVLVAILFLFAGAVASAAPVTGFDISAKGAIGIDGLRFELVHLNEDWSKNRLNSLEVTKGGRADGGGSFSIEGDWLLKGRPVRLRQTYALADGGGLDYAAKIEAPEKIAGRGFHLGVNLPLQRFNGAPIVADGIAHVFPVEAFKPGLTAFHGKARRIEIPLSAGVLTIEGDCYFRLQDNRAYKISAFELRLSFGDKGGAGTDIEAALKFSYAPYRHSPVSLAAVANMGFADEMDGDRKGGWTDQGAENDLRSFPVGEAVYADIPFSIVDPGKNNGKASVVLKGPARAWLPRHREIVLPEPVTAKYLYLLHATAWDKPGAVVGKVTVESASAEFVEKEVIEFPIKSDEHTANFWSPRKLAKAVVAWRGKNPSSDIGLYMTRLDLANKPVARISLESTGESVWMIAGLTLSDKRAGDQPPADPIVIVPGEDYAEMAGVREVKEGGILDFSPLLDAPAGKHGFLRNVDGRFEFAGQPGVPVRFYGGNYTGIPPADKTQIEANARALAAMGFNIARLHHFDQPLANHGGGSSLDMRADAWDRLDYFVAECKRRGIYVTLDLFTSRKLTRGEVPGVPDGILSSPANYKALLYVNDAVFDNFAEYARRLMTHVNPYTGLAWKDDPAIALVSLINENTIYAVQGASSHVRQVYQQKFEDYAKEHGLTVSPSERDFHWRKFLFDTYLAAHGKLRKLAEEIGLKTPLTDQNYWAILPTSLHREHYDYVDFHFYWRHPVFLDERLWKGRVQVANASAVSAHGGALLSAAPPRIWGLPYTISEWDFVAPSSSNTEGAFLAGAYAAAQDWGGLMRFSYFPDSLGVRPDSGPVRMLHLGRDPQVNLSERAGALFFLRGDVSPSAAAYPVLLSRGHLDAKRSDNYPRLAARLGLLGKTGTLIVDAQGGITLPANTRAAVALDAGDARRAGPAPVHTIEEANTALGLDRDHFVNDTGELAMDVKRGVFSAVTARSEGFVVPEGRTAEGKFATVKSRKSFAAVLVAAMDGKPLETSDRYLLLHLTDTKNSNQRFGDEERSIVEDWGGLPLLARRGEVEISLGRDLSAFALHALDFAGNRLHRVAMKQENGRSIFSANNVHDGRIVAAYELTKEQ